MTDWTTDWTGSANRGPGLRDRLRHWREARRRQRATSAELRALSDRDLADLGISRADIPGIAREAAAGG